MGKILKAFELIGGVLAGVLLASVALPRFADAQQVVSPCVKVPGAANPSSCNPISATNRMPTTQASNTLSTGQVTVGTTATLIVPARAGRVNLQVSNYSTTDTFCGPAGVTTANGYLLTGTKGATVILTTAAAVYCIVATGTELVSWAETY